MTQLTTSLKGNGTAALARPLAESIPFPADIPALFRRVARLPGAIFLDSARPDATLGRFSYLSAQPFETIVSRPRGDHTGTSCVVTQANGERTQSDADPFSVLTQRLASWPGEPLAELPPFQGGAVGLFGYDLCHHLEQLPRPRYDDFQTPDLCVGLYDWVIALDHVAQQAWAIAVGLSERGSSRERRASQRIAWIRQLAVEAKQNADRGHDDAFPDDRWSAEMLGRSRRTVSLAPQFPLQTERAQLTSNLSRDDYLRRIERAIEYIYAGDVYQVNLAQRLLFPLDESPVDLYLRLRARNPAPFASYFDAGDFVIASASPERFLRVEQRAVETRPIKGTRPRWPTPLADMYSAGELLGSHKDRAENVMIVDLLRNDLGRVCEYGSVQVTAPLRLESYQFVHHLVSEVRGRLRASCGPVDLLRAAFPGGSVTGAPKIRAMEIIAELEPTARGPYCGSLGYISFGGSMDTNILIRTFTCRRGWSQFPVGGGIVAESVPEREYEETLHKAEGLIRALRP